MAITRELEAGDVRGTGLKGVVTDFVVRWISSPGVRFVCRLHLNALQVYVQNTRQINLMPEVGAGLVGTGKPLEFTRVPFT